MREIYIRCTMISARNREFRNIMVSTTDELVFVPLGGIGEIGMNAGLYGFGTKKNRRWLLVDCGIAFAGEELPGIDIIMPDLAFLESQRDRLEAILITHAHEDHIGALMDLWPKLRAPVYATRFAASLLEIRKFNEPGAQKIPIHTVEVAERYQFGPFDIEFVPMAHSIPESTGIAIRTPLGMVFHSGDWKIDETPFVGWKTDEKRIRELGEEGVLAFVSDSTNVVRDGISPSETEVAHSLKDIIASSTGRVAVTTFASNVARIRAVAEAAAACGREVIAVGRAMDRVIEVAKESGYLDGLPDFRSVDVYGYLPRDKVVALITGSQGEPRAALARIAEGNHPDMTLTSGDKVIFSSRAIPGNEKGISKLINKLVEQGIEVMTDRDGLVHVSGHPRRGEMERMYSWVKPHISIPAHGEALHLEEHRKLAKKMGVAHAIRIHNGQMVRIAPGKPELFDAVQVGRIYKDGSLLIPQADPAVSERRRLSNAGIVSVAMAIDAKGMLVGEVALAVFGLPQTSVSGQSFEDIVEEAIFSVLDTLPKAKMRDPDTVESAVERAIRSQVNQNWGKKPSCHVQVVTV